MPNPPALGEKRATTISMWLLHSVWNGPVLVHAPEADTECLEHEEGGQQLLGQHLPEARQWHDEFVRTPLLDGGDEFRVA